MAEHKETRSATRRDGVVISVGGHVTTDFHPSCAGCVYTVDQITPFSACESGHMVLVKFEHESSKLINGARSQGLDVNWFKLHAATATETSPEGPQLYPEPEPEPTDDTRRAEPAEDIAPPLPGNRKRRGGRGLGGRTDGQLDLAL